MTRSRLIRSACALAGAAALVLGPAITAAAQDGEPVVTNRESVQAFLNSDGTLDVARVYDQIAIYGSGTVLIKNPVSTEGLRNLDGFGGYDVEDGEIGLEVDVDGDKRFRTVSDFTGELPVTVVPEYRLDGDVVDADDIVGKSGTLEVRYTVRNVTSKPTEVTYTDGDGNEATATVDVPLPLVGQLTTILPSTFTGVDSAEANAAGDGRGATQLTFTMTLFPPIGSDTAEFGYTAEVRDAVLPPANVSIVPVQPLHSPTFSGGAESIQSGAESGLELAAGAGEIDANLLRLRDGAAELLGGLQQLSAGADELRAGLNDEAAPGARELADGADEAAAGAEELSDGLNDKLAPGANQLADGAKQVAEGLGEIAGASGVPAAVVGARLLQDGVQQKILPGLAQVAGGLTLARTGTEEIAAGVNVGVGEITGEVTGKLAPGVDTIEAGVTAALAPKGPLERLVGVLTDIQSGTAECTGSCQLRVAAAIEGVTGQEGLIPQLTAAQGGLSQVSDGLDALVVGLGKLSAGLTDALTGADGLRAGIDRLLVGTGELDAGVRGELLGGLVDLESGLLRAVTGLGQLQDGGDDLAEGADELADGAGDAAAGADELSDGLNDELAPGADELADGLGEAADGSEQLADGLDEAAGGAPELVDGAEQLSVEGTSQLKAAGADTAADYGTDFAVIEAATQRAEEEAMPYGAPEGAIASAAYSLTIAGEDGEGGRNVGRTVGALALLGGAVGVGFLARRRESA